MIAIRAARPDDSAEILRLLRLLAAYEGEPGAVTADEETIRRDGFGKYFETLVAEQDGRVVGLLNLYQGYSSWRGAPMLMIHDFFLEEAARGKGTGRAMVEEVRRLGLKRGCCRIEVNVVTWNESGRRFYERLAFGALENWLPYRLRLDFE